MHRQIYRMILAAGLACALAGCGSAGRVENSVGTSAEAAVAESAAPAAETQTASQPGAADTGEDPSANTAVAAGTESADQFGGVVSAAKLAVNNAGLSIGDGRVYVLNADPRADAALQTLATLYTDLGGYVTVVTISSGDYNNELKDLLKQGEYPTVFNLGSESDATKWKDYLYDLSGSDVASHVADPSLDIHCDGKTAAVPASVRVYGIICNRTILESYCKMSGALISSPDDIQSLATLSAVADDIETRLQELNAQLAADGKSFAVTEAFASPSMDAMSAWKLSEQLAALPVYYELKDKGVTDFSVAADTLSGTYLDNFRQVFDLYTGDSAADVTHLADKGYDAEQEFGSGQAVFWQGGDSDYGALTSGKYAVTPADLDIIPIYFGVDDANEGLCVDSDYHWAVNAKATDEEIQASLTFLEWLYTSDAGRVALGQELGMICPYDTCTGDFAPANAFGAKAILYGTQGKTSVPWAYTAVADPDSWRSGLTSALTSYAAGGGTWDDVKKAFSYTS